MKYSINSFSRGLALTLAVTFLFGQLSITFQPALAVRPSPGSANAGEKPLRKADSATVHRAAESHGRLPLSFEANGGQFDAQVKFASRAAGYSLGLTQTGAALALRRGEASINLRMRFAGATPNARMEGLDPLPGKSNYLIGSERSKWRIGVANYAKVRYREIYRGIDLLFYGDRRQLEYDFIVQPGADPNTIQISFDGAERMNIDRNGDLVLQTSGGEVRQQKPAIYQEVNGQQRIVEGKYVIRNQTVGFEIAAYDKTKPLVIDPVLVYSTRGIGGESIAVDAQGNVYVTGTVQTGIPSVPPLLNPIQSSRSNGADLYVAKLNAAGTALVYSTYLGGNGDDSAGGIAVDAAGNAYVTGRTESSNFPGALNSHNFTPLFKSSNGGTAWSSGGALPPGNAQAIAIDPKTPSTIYLAMRAPAQVFKSTDGGVSWRAANAGLPAGTAQITSLTIDPVNPSTLYVSFNGQRNVFKSADGGANWNRVASGLPDFPEINVVAVSPATPATIYAGTAGGGVYKSVDSGGGWSAVNTGFQNTPNVQALVIDPANPNTIYLGSTSGFFKSVNGGGSWSESSDLATTWVTSIAILPSDPATLFAGTKRGVFKSVTGGVYWSLANGTIPLPDSPSTGLTGFTTVAAAPGNPATIYAGAARVNGPNGVYKSTDGGGSWSRVSNGLVNAHIIALAIDPQNPATLYAGALNKLQSIETGAAADAFVTKLDANGSAIVYSRYLGGGDLDAGADIAMDAAGQAYVAGSTRSIDFPATPTGFQPDRGARPASSNDAFVARLDANGSIGHATYLGGGGIDTAVRLALDGQSNLYLIGTTTSTDFPTKDSLQSNLGSSDGNAFVAKLDLKQSSAASLTYSTYLGGDKGTVARDIAVDPAGNIHALTAPILTLAHFFLGTNKSSGLGTLTKLNSTGGAILYTRQFGKIVRYQVRNVIPHDVPDQFHGLAVDATGNAYLTGSTPIGAGFPVTPGAFQQAHGNLSGNGCPTFSPSQPPNCSDAFVMKVNPNASALVYSSYLGGDGFEIGSDIAVDAEGNAYVTGLSTTAGFPITPGALPSSQVNAFVTKISADSRPTTLASVSAASFARAPLAPESIVAAFGAGLARGTEAATATPLPVSLLGTSVVVTDSAGTERPAALFFVSPSQINYQMPKGTATGPATVAVKFGDAIVATEQLEIANVSPSLFTANASGQGFPAAFAQRNKPDGSVTYEPVARFDAAQNRFVAVPIDVSSETDQVFLVLFGTGFRNRSALSAVSVNLGDANLPVIYAGDQLQLAGLDQINATLARSLAGKGEVDVVVTVDGKIANMVRVSIK